MHDGAEQSLARLAFIVMHLKRLKLKKINDIHRLPKNPIRLLLASFAQWQQQQQH